MIGKFRARALSTDIELVGENRSPKITIQFEITEDDPSVKGQSVYADRFLTEKALPYTYDDLKACGFTGGPADIVDLEGLRDATMALRNEVILTCEEEQYKKDGKTKTKTVVKFINKLGGGPAVARNQMSDRDKQVLRAQLKSASVSIPRESVPGNRAPAGQKPGSKRSEFEDL